MQFRDYSEEDSDRNHATVSGGGFLIAVKTVGLSRDNGRQEAGYPVFCFKRLAYSFGER